MFCGNPFYIELQKYRNFFYKGEAQSFIYLKSILFKYNRYN